MNVRRFLLVLLLIGSIAAAPATRPVLPREFEVTDLADKVHRPFAGDAKAVVLLFVGVECPVSNSYAPEISRLANEFVARGIEFYVVYAGTDVTRDKAVKHAKDYVFSCPAVLDPHCDLATAVGANTTLEAAVMLPDGSLVYRGRMDDQYITFGKKRFAATQHDLRDVLEAVAAGKPIEPRVTPVVGCMIVKPETK
ncbi:hypothetical protein BH10PLA1_BH10PLA1_14540 [soil metagenome]